VILQQIFRRRLCRWLMFALLCGVLSGCVGYRQTLDQVDALAHKGQYQQALTLIDDSQMASSRLSRLLYLMERGLLLNLSGDYRASHQALQQADDLTEELVTRSVSGEALSFVINDSTVPYRGEDYESAYLNYYKALNFVAQDQYEAAAVEARRVDEKLNWYFDLYKGKNSYREDGFLRFLTGLLYEAYGDDENAQVAYRQSLAAYRKQQSLYQVTPPDALWARLLSVLKRLGDHQQYTDLLAQAPPGTIDEDDGGLLVLLLDRGQIPAKEESSILLPTTRGPVRISIPVLERSAPLSGDVTVRVDGVVAGRPELVGNVEAIARRSMEDKKGRIIAKETARTVTKEALTRRAEGQLGDAAGALVRVISILTANADLRFWRLLPSRVELLTVPLKPGPHQVEISLGGQTLTRSVTATERGPVFLHHRFFR